MVIAWLVEEVTMVHGSGGLMSSALCTISDSATHSVAAMPRP